jgi:hypothetical protein
MRKTTYIIGAVALFTLGCISGVLIEHQLQTFANDAAREFAGFGQSVTTATPVGYWSYPDAELQSGGSGGGITLNDEILIPPTYKAIWTTPDSFEDVIRFYSEHLGFEDSDRFMERQPIAGQGYRGTDTADGPDFKHHIRDNRIPNELRDILRPVRVESFVRRCRSYFLTVFITRADGENHTHIVVVYDPWTEIEDNK